MIRIYDDILKFLFVEPLCVPTNGFIRNNGSGVMRAGLAKAVYDILGDVIEHNLGEAIRKNGNVVQPIWWTSQSRPAVIAFPVKPISLMVTKDNIGEVMNFRQSANMIGKTIPGFQCKASMKMIERSTHELLKLIEKKEIEKLYIPLVGCGMGELNEEDVLSCLNILPDSVCLVLQKRVGRVQRNSGQKMKDK